LPNYRSRLVAREIRKAGEDPIFAPTPPLESLRTIISLAATTVKGERPHVRDPLSEQRTQVSFMDISRAYFCAATDPEDPTYVELPPEDEECGVKVGLLKKHMYGTRRAADGWHSEYAGRLVEELGFSCGDASACVFYRPAGNAWRSGLRCGNAWRSVLAFLRSVLAFRRSGVLMLCFGVPALRSGVLGVLWRSTFPKLFQCMDKKHNSGSGRFLKCLLVLETCDKRLWSGRNVFRRRCAKTADVKEVVGWCLSPKGQHQRFLSPTPLGTG